ncbi:hypothetical protein JY651_00560 [Pyxidicoccus parkwayensis]|uniref:Uncharacterized protein n=1 Tax=Pyxidicoccus parkwayensis TaxID=2813578 RepID=A0ABX7NYK0_9BACT|nr:hypothetical protein [Pyxidicoccus parkwaysis]QSQ23511.1 hypothetical protein JY651_00560 [Pyxidicoccus parkwaysis]
MRTTLALFLGAALCISTAWAQEPQPPRPQPSRSNTEMEETTIDFAEVPDDYLTRAQSRFSSDKKGAAQDLRKAAASIALSAGRARGEAKSGLEDAARGLRDVAKGVEDGSVKSASELKQSLASASHAVANAHYFAAQAAWERNEAARAGHELASAGEYLEHSAKWTGTEAEKAVRTSVRDARTLSGDLIRGAEVAPDKVGAGIAAVGRDIEAVGGKLKATGGAGKSGETQQGVGGSGVPKPQKDTSGVEEKPDHEKYEQNANEQGPGPEQGRDDRPKDENPSP